MSVAFVFPGQGAQSVGMGLDLAAAYPSARAVFDAVDAALPHDHPPCLSSAPRARSKR